MFFFFGWNRMFWLQLNESHVILQHIWWRIHDFLFLNPVSNWNLSRSEKKNIFQSILMFDVYCTFRKFPFSHVQTWKNLYEWMKNTCRVPCPVHHSYNLNTLEHSWMVFLVWNTTWAPKHKRDRSELNFYNQKRDSDTGIFLPFKICCDTIFFPSFFDNRKTFINEWRKNFKFATCSSNQLSMSYCLLDTGYCVLFGVRGTAP